VRGPVHRGRIGFATLSPIAAALVLPPFHKQWGSYDNNPLVVEKGMTAREARAIDAEGKGGGLVDGKQPDSRESGSVRKGKSRRSLTDKVFGNF